MTEKAKKRLTIAGISVLGLALVVAIGIQFTKAPSEPDALPQQPEQNSSSMQPGVPTPDVVVTPPNASASEPTEALPPQTDLPEQKLQPDPVKPDAPEAPKTSDGSDRTPDTDAEHEFTSESTDTPPTYAPEDTEIKPTSPSQPQAGGGLPGFDNVPNAGANQGEHLDDMYENGNKIGDMD